MGRGSYMLMEIYFLSFLGPQLDCISPFPLQVSVANAVWAEELCLSQVCSIELPKLILSALCPPVCNMSTPGHIEC